MAKQVERQIVLPWSQVMKISFNSLKVRLFRSFITTVTLALAVAFVSYTWAGYRMLNAVWHQLDPAVQEQVLSAGYELTDGLFGSSQKDRWLAILSLLVCVVGIVNAQLMAVTERFREIGTYKCLGALNSFVVRIFVLEAAYQGLLGGVVGSLAGLLISTAVFSFNLGLIVLIRWPVAGMLFIVAWTSLLSVLLSLIGVVYPALVAARMQPAAALRTE